MKIGFTRTLNASILAMALCLNRAHAHPGHSFAESNASHILTSPWHLLTLVVAGLAMFGVSRFAVRPAVRRGLQCGAALALLAAASLWGFR
jgi:hypothetical protein